MSDDLWIWIPNWFGDGKRAGYQHYGDRDPIWIKNYTRLLSHNAYTDLSLAARGLLHGIWMEYAVSSRKLPGSTSVLSRRLSHQVTRRTLDSLVHAGFIELVASDVLAERYRTVRSTRAREKKNYLRSSSKSALESRHNGGDSRAQEPDRPFACKCGRSFALERNLALHVQNVHDGPPVPLTSNELGA